MSAAERRPMESDEALLRTLIGQVATLTTQIKGLSVSLEEKVVERRNHADGLEGRVNAMDARVRAIELAGAEGKTMPESVKDHEKRIRVLESMKWQVLALAFLGSGAGWIVTNLVMKL